MPTPTPARSSTNTNDEINYELKSEYDGLSTELKKYFDTKQADFIKKSKASHSDPSSYTQDRGEFLVNEQIDNVDSYRSEVWNYLIDEFNKNTKEKYLNAKTHSQNKKEIDRKTKDLNELTKKFNNFKSQNTTNNRQKEIVLYEYNRRNDQLFIMKVIGIVLLVCIIITVLINKLLPYEFIYFVMLIFVCLLVYVIYYLFIKDLGRSKRYWDKYNFAKPPQDFDSVKSISPVQLEDVDKAIDTNLDKYLDECRTPTTPAPPRNTTSPK